MIITGGLCIAAHKACLAFAVVSLVSNRPLGTQSAGSMLYSGGIFAIAYNKSKERFREIRFTDLDSQDQDLMCYFDSFSGRRISTEGAATSVRTVRLLPEISIAGRRLSRPVREFISERFITR